MDSFRVVQLILIGYSIPSRRWRFLQDLSEQQRFGEALPDFSLRTLDGRIASAGHMVAGRKGAVIVVWSSTCSHCIRYDKYFNTFEQRYPELGLLIVSSRQGEAIESVQKAATQ